MLAVKIVKMFSPSPISRLCSILLSMEQPHLCSFGFLRAFIPFSLLPSIYWPIVISVI